MGGRTLKIQAISERGRISLLFLLIMLLAKVPYNLESQTFYEDIDMALHLRLQQMRQAQPPEVYGNSILFTYSPDSYTDGLVRTAGISFAHESYRTIHPFQRIITQDSEGNLVHTGVFFILYPIPKELDHLDYRLIVDGLWKKDPQGPQTVVAESGLEVSRFSLPRIASKIYSSPEVHSNQRVTFRYQAASGQRVFLTGSFNNWDPFMYRLKEDPSIPGLYTLQLRLSEGAHFYRFIHNGESLTDPLNSNYARRNRGELVSVVQVPSSRLALQP